MTHGAKDEIGQDETRAPLRGGPQTHDDDSLCLPLPPEFEDPEGWMSERRAYWVWLGEVGAPTRASWLRHQWMKLFGRGGGERLFGSREAG